MVSQKMVSYSVRPTARSAPASYQARANPSPAPVPAAVPASSVAAAPSQGPSLMGRMAATAGGVAIGSAVGHTVGHAMTGLFSGGGNEVAASVPQQNSPIGSTQQQTNGVCDFEIKQFLQCAEQQSDISLCQGFNEALRQCKMSNGIFHSYYFNFYIRIKLTS